MDQPEQKDLTPKNQRVDVKTWGRLICCQSLLKGDELTFFSTLIKVLEHFQSVAPFILSMTNTEALSALIESINAKIAVEDVRLAINELNHVVFLHGRCPNAPQPVRSIATPSLAVARTHDRDFAEPVHGQEVIYPEAGKPFTTLTGPTAGEADAIIVRPLVGAEHPRDVDADYLRQQAVRVAQKAQAALEGNRQFRTRHF